MKVKKIWGWGSRMRTKSRGLPGVGTRRPTQALHKALALKAAVCILWRRKFKRERKSLEAAVDTKTKEPKMSPVETRLS